MNIITNKKGTTIDLSYLNLTDIPDECFHVKNVTCLTMKYNEMKSIPVDEILRFKKLRSLDLSHNEIEVIPINLIKLQHLSNIDVSYNKIRTIPVELHPFFVEKVEGEVIYLHPSHVNIRRRKEKKFRNKHLNRQSFNPNKYPNQGMLVDYVVDDMNIHQRSRIIDYKNKFINNGSSRLNYIGNVHMDPEINQEKNKSIDIYYKLKQKDDDQNKKDEMNKILEESKINRNYKDEIKSTNKKRKTERKMERKRKTRLVDMKRSRALRSKLNY